jgi:hypothetical protein
MPRVAATIWPRMCAWPGASAVSLQPAALELLKALAPVLVRWGRWYVFGAQAVIVYGVPRLSADVDVTLALAPDAPERLAADLATAGFTLRVQDPEFIRRTRVMPFVHEPTGMPLDIVLAGSGLEDEFLDRARATDIGGISVPLIELSDLIIAKVLAGRPKDLDDATALWRLHDEELDTDRVRDTLRRLEQALSTARRHVQCLWPVRQRRISAGSFITRSMASISIGRFADRFS